MTFGSLASNNDGFCMGWQAPSIDDNLDACWGKCDGSSKTHYAEGVQ
jgi:hypothetical protein